MTPVLRAESVSRVFRTSAGDVHACRDVSLEVRAGELLVVRGPSGSGKSTLLNLLGGLDDPTNGRIWIGGQDLGKMTESELVAVRREQLGYVFQSFGLIPILSAAENVEVPLRIRRMDPAARSRTVAEVLDLVGLSGHADQRPYELSGGQQQRVGIARALASSPRILLADEPTGQLDSRTAADMMNLIGDLVHTRGVAAIVTTHDPLLMDRADRVLELHDGRILPSMNTESVGRHALEGRPGPGWIS
jgi:putative ABC transport system ATP-binding protein